MGLAKERFFIAGHLVGYTAAGVSGLYTLGQFVELDSLNKEITKQTVPLTEQYTREWAGTLTFDQTRYYLAFPTQRDLDRNRFVDQQIKNFHAFDSQREQGGEINARILLGLAATALGGAFGWLCKQARDAENSKFWDEYYEATHPAPILKPHE
jgi:hypothetical protein